jgi:glycyl-tRNA synthetase
MVKDMKSGECLRADHLLEDVMEARSKDGKLTAEERTEAKIIHAQADTYDKAGLQELFAKYEIKSPGGAPLSEPEDFNMMFGTQIGPSGQLKGFLRPETAQGIFLAYKRLYEFNNSKLPFAGAQIGTAYRNEISPKAGVLRVREFQMAEIEYFMDPLNKTLRKFKTVADLEVPLFCQNSQMTGTPLVVRTLGDAVADGMIDNETLGYFMGRIFLFIKSLGTDMKRFRFRQHLKNEMAHYATDCWDVELHTSYGWIECVGCADRSAFDLDAHAVGSGIKLEAAIRLAEPVTIERTVVVPNKKTMGKALKKDAKIVTAYFESLDNEGAAAIGAELEASGEAKFTVDGKEFTLGKDVISVAVKSETQHERKFTPSVIEPSFGIGRIMYCLLEHVYDVRENDAQRGYLKLPPNMAPVKCSLLPLSAGNEEFEGPQEVLTAALTEAGVSCRVDDSTAQIGRRYARTDEIGIPFGITIDFETKDDGMVTLRERDSMGQIRLLIADVAPLVAALESGKTTWAETEVKYGVAVTGAAKEGEGAGADGN